MQSTTRALAVALASAAVVAATPAAGQAATQHSSCAKTFTVQMFRSAAITAYAGTRIPSRSDLAHLRRYERCARHSWARPVDERVWGRSRAANSARRQPPLNYSSVSWYNDAGTHCCGVYATYGVAACGSGACYPQGTRIEFCDHGCVVATVDDHGPYVGGRAFDLNQNVAAAIGFGGLGVVGWRVL
jgi:hypothetical protein